MAQHTGGAKMEKVEKKIDKKAPQGVTHHGHSGGAKMADVEKKIEKETKKQKKSLKNLWGLLGVVMVALSLCIVMASCSGGQDIPSYSTTQLAQKYETDDPTDLKGVTMYVTGQFYERSGDNFTLVPVDSDGDGYGVTFKFKDTSRKINKVIKKNADMTDDVTVLATVTKVTKSGYVFEDVQSIEISDMVS